MGEDPGFIPPWMSEKAEEMEKEGVSTFASLEEKKELLEMMEKIPEEKFRNMKTMMGNIERLFDRGGTDLDVFRNMTDDLVESIKIELESLVSPLKNELIALINTLLEPILPYLEAAVNNIILPFFQTAVKSWEAILTGQWDQLFTYLQTTFPGLAKFKDYQRKVWSDAFWGSGIGQARINKMLERYGVTIEELESGTLNLDYMNIELPSPEEYEELVRESEEDLG